MSELVYAADTWKTWSSLEVGKRKLRAAKAVHSEAYGDLWLLTLAYLQFKGHSSVNFLGASRGSTH